MSNQAPKTVFCVILVDHSEGITLVSVNPTQPPDNSWAKKGFESEALADEIVDLYTRTGKYLAAHKAEIGLKGLIDEKF